jgi:hypothetical protein
MEKEIKKQVNVCMKLGYTETCNLLKGGVAFIEIKGSELVGINRDDYIYDDVYPICQISVRIDAEALKNLEFMSVYLQNKEKGEQAFKVTSL